MGDHFKGRHHRGRHDRYAALVVAAANRLPDYCCPRCGLTLAEGIAQWGARAGRWEAGHIVPGKVATSTADYRAEHAHCNRSAGAQMRNRRMSTGYDWP